MSRRAFSEIRNPGQTPAAPHLRYFQNDYFDLFVWSEDDGRCWGFQLCYDRGFDEHSLTWRRASRRVEHHRVDETGSGFAHVGTPLLQETSALVPATVGPRFRESAGTLPEAIREVIETALTNHLGDRWTGPK